MLDHRKSKGIFKKSISASVTTLKSLTVWITTNWKILQEMGIPDHLTCLLRTLYAGQAATEWDMEQQSSAKFGKEYVMVVYCHSAYPTYMQSTSHEILVGSQAGIKISGRNINNLYDTTLMI